MRIAVSIGAMMLAIGAAQAQTVDDSKRPVPRDVTVREAMLRVAVEAARRDDCNTARQALDPALADEAALRTLPADLVFDAYEAAAACAHNGKDENRAYALAMRATREGKGSRLLWNIRLDHERQTLQPAAVVATLEAMEKTAPEMLRGIDVLWLNFLDQELEDTKQTPLRQRLLRVLASPDYAPDEVLGSRDNFLHSYAKVLIARGDKAGAAAIVGQISEPWYLLETSFDLRFRGMLPADLDFRAAVTRVLERAQAARRAHPELLHPVLIVATQQRMLGNADAALATLETVRNVVASPEAYEDSERQLNWWWDGLSRTYAMLGRQSDAEAAMRAGAGVGENGGLNVSQLINLAYRQLSSSPKAALVTLAPFTTEERPMSPYGESEMRFARGCANALLGNRAAAADDLAFIEARRADVPQAHTNLLICLGEVDRAAAALIRRLDDPDQRARVLIMLSDFDDPLATAPIDPVTSRLPALKARPDVQAAIARAGGTRRIHLQAVDM